MARLSNILTALLLCIFSLGHAQASPFLSLSPKKIYSLGTYRIDQVMPSIGGMKFDLMNPGTFYTLVTTGQIAKWLLGTTAPVWAVNMSMPAGIYSEAIAVSHDGALVAVADSPDSVALLNAADGSRLQHRFRFGSAYPLSARPLVTSLAFSPDGSMLAAGDINGFIAIWAFSSEWPLAVLGVPSSPVRAVRFADDPRFLVSSNAKDVVIWNIDEQKVAANLNDLSSGHYWFEDAFVPDYERYLVITSIDETLIFDLSAQKVVKTYKTNPAIAHDSSDHSRYGPLLTVTDPDLKLLYRFHKNPYVEVLNLESGEVKSTYKDVQDTSALQFGPYFTHVSLVPRGCGQFVVGTERFAINIFRGALENHLELREYQLPCD